MLRLYWAGLVMSALEWLPVGIGLLSLTCGLIGLLLASLAAVRRNHPRLLRGSALYVIAGLLLLAPAAGFIAAPPVPAEKPRVSAPAPVRETPARATLTLLSDPSGADVLVDGVVVGRTPYRTTLPVGSTFVYEVRAGSGVADPSLYEVFRGSYDVTEDVSVSVWLDRKE